MDKQNGWNFYLKIKELEKAKEDAPLHIDDVVAGLGVSRGQAADYLDALSVLQFIRFSDHSKESFVIISTADPM